MSSLRRDSRLDRVYQCVKLATNRYLATCQTGIALIDTTTQIAVSGWIEHNRPLGIVRIDDNAAAFADAAGDVWVLTLTGDVMTVLQGGSGATRPWTAFADGYLFYSGRSPSEWKREDGVEGSFGGKAADFVSSFGNRLYAFDKAGWLSVYDLDEDRVVEVTELVGCTGGIALVELPCDSRFSYVSIRDRMVYVYEEAMGGYVITDQTPVDYVDGLPGDVPWWNQPGVVTVQPPLTFGNGFVRTEEEQADCEPDFQPIPPEPYPQDAAFVCSGDDPDVAGLYAGRYLGRWPLQTSFAADAGYDPVAVVPSSGNYSFTTVGGKSCVIGTGNPSITDFIATFSHSVRSTGYTISVCRYSAWGSQRAGVSLNAVVDSISASTANVEVAVDSSGVPPSPVAGTPDGVWQHFALSFGSNQLVSGYLDGILIFTSDSPSASACRIRDNIRCSSGAIFGTLAFRNMRAYSKTLSAGEIADIAAADLS